MNRIALVAALLGSGIAVPLAAATSCRDLKGLYTPCPPAVAHRAARVRATAIEDAAPPAPSGPPALPERVPVVARAKLCHDLKGLFTPCPR